MSFIVGKNISKSYKLGKNNILKVLDNVNIEVKQGEFVALVGPSGSGKSTLLYILGLLDNINSGEVIFYGYPMHKYTEDVRTDFRLKYLGYVFQDFNLINELTISENLEIISKANGVSNIDAKNKAKSALEEVGLGSQVNKYPSELSGGQQQRVSIARAIINNPSILFADEPTANLDSKNSQDIINLFRDLNKKFHMTIIMVTHEDEFKSQVDRVITLKDGKIIN